MPGLSALFYMFYMFYIVFITIMSNDIGCNVNPINIVVIMNRDSYIYYDSENDVEHIEHIEQAI